MLILVVFSSDSLDSLLKCLNPSHAIPKHRGWLLRNNISHSYQHLMLAAEIQLTHTSIPLLAAEIQLTYTSIPLLAAEIQLTHTSIHLLAAEIQLTHTSTVINAEGILAKARGPEPPLKTAASCL
jgi:hypothetical protein